MKKIRVVDDDVTIIELIKVILEEVEGIEPVITGSDFQRLFKAKHWEGIDGALIDCHLRSTVTGFDILHYLKENHPHIRRVAFTAMQIDTAELGDLAHVLLTKPSSPNDIAEAFDV